MRWRKEITDYANLKEVNRRLAEENADWRNRHISSYAPVEDLFVRINDTIRRQEYSVLTAKVVNSTWHKQKNFLTLDKGATAGLHKDMGVIGTDGHRGRGARCQPAFRLRHQRAEPGYQDQCAAAADGPFRPALLGYERPRHGLGHRHRQARAVSQWAIPWRRAVATASSPRACLWAWLTEVNATRAATTTRSSSNWRRT